MSDTGTVLSVRYLMAKEATMSTSAILPISSVDFAESGTAVSAAAPSSGATATTVDTTPTANTIAEGLILSQIQLSLITNLLRSSSAAPTDAAVTNSDSSLTNFLNEAYPAGGLVSDNSSSTSPYNALVEAIQSSLAAGSGIADASLAYLNSTGNFVRTSA
jgi:hypothetical protein